MDRDYLYSQEIIIHQNLSQFQVINTHLETILFSSRSLSRIYLESQNCILMIENQESLYFIIYIIAKLNSIGVMSECELMKDIFGKESWHIGVTYD